MGRNCFAGGLGTGELFVGYVLVFAAWPLVVHVLRRGKRVGGTEAGEEGQHVVWHMWRKPFGVVQLSKHPCL